MPLFNHEKYIGAAIDSVLAQSFRDFELIICNDGSTDQSGAIARSYVDHRIHVINKPNGGTATALNSCLLASRGRYICWLSSDDVFAPNKLLTHHLHHEANADSRLSVAPFGFMDMTGERRSPGHQPTPSPKSRLIQFLYGNYISGLSICAERSMFELHGIFDDRYHCAQDVDRWVHFFRQEEPTFLSGDPQTYTRTGSGHEENAGIFGLLDVVKLLSNQILRYGISALAPKEGEEKPSQEFLTAILENLFNPTNLFFRFHMQEHLASVVCYTGQKYRLRSAYGTALDQLRARPMTKELETACGILGAIVAKMDAGGIDQPIALVEAMVQLKQSVESTAQRELLQKYLVNGF